METGNCRFIAKIVMYVYVEIICGKFILVFNEYYNIFIFQKFICLACKTISKVHKDHDVEDEYDMKSVVEKQVDAGAKSQARSSDLKIALKELLDSQTKVFLCSFR